MNVSEALRTQSLLAWLISIDQGGESLDVAVSDARFLADRSMRALGAGEDADQVERAMLRRFAGGCRPPSSAARMRPPDRLDRLARLSQLLAPCPRPDVEAGWDLCAHAEPWPCVMTRAAWLAADATESDDEVGP